MTDTKENVMNEAKLTTAMNLLERAANHMEEQAPDKTWWREYFLLTGQHMILTEEGWESADSKQSYIDDYAAHGEVFEPLDEVNAPK